MASQDIVVHVGADISDLTSDLQNASQQVSSFSQATQNSFRELGNVGKAMTGAGVAIAGGLGLAVNTAAQFEKAVSRVGALSGATDSEMSKLTATAEELGRTTSFSATQAAEGMSYLAMAGYKTNDIIAAMPGLLSAAAAGQTDLATTADITSNIMSGFGIAAEETARVADVLTKTFTNSNTDLQMLGYTMKYVAPVAKASGQSLESMAAAAGVLGNAGIQADSAGTALRMMLIRLAKPPKMAKDALEELGISVSDSEGNMKDLSVIIGEMNEATKDMAEAERLAAVAKISGTEASAAMLALMDAGQGTIEDFTKELENSGGTADEIASKQLDNLLGQITLLKSALEGAAISIGNALLPAMKTITTAVNEAVNWFNGLSESTKKYIAIGAALTAVFLLVVGPLLILVGLIPSIIAGFTAIGGAFAVLTGPVGLVIAAIVAVGAALVALWQSSETFRNSVTEIFTKIKDVAVQVFGIVASFIGEKIAQIRQFWEENGGQFLTAVENVFNGIKAVIEFIMPAVLFIVEMVWTAIKQVIDGALNVIMGLVKVFSGLFTGDFGKLWEGVKQIFKGAIDLIIGWMTLTFVGGLRTLLTNLAKGALTIIKNMGTGIVNFFKSFATTGQNLAKGMVDAVLKFFRNLYNTASNIFNMLRTFGANIWNSISQTILGVARNIWNGVKTNFQNMLNSIKSIFSTVKSTISTIWNGVMDFFKRIDLRQIGKNIIQGLINGIGSMASAVWEKAKSIANGIGNSIKNALGIKSPSRVLMELGEYTGEGFALGLDSMIKDIKGASNEMAKAAVPELSLAYNTPKVAGSAVLPGIGSDSGSGRNDSKPIYITNVFEVDGYEMARVTEPYIDSMQTEKIVFRTRAGGLR